jgi:hypothetical protein
MSVVLNLRAEDPQGAAGLFKWGCMVIPRAACLASPARAWFHPLSSVLIVVMNNTNYFTIVTAFIVVFVIFSQVMKFCSTVVKRMALELIPQCTL